jgi:type II secretory pathway component PulF
VWPSTDEQLDAWLASQSLPQEEQDWIRGVVKRRIEEARGAALPTATLAPAPASTPKPAPPRPLPRKLSFDDLATLNRELLELVQARVPLPLGLATYASDLESGRLAAVMDFLRADLEQGLPLSDAMGRAGDALPPIYKALVRAGEASGDLASSLVVLTEQAETDAEISRRTREALAYPAVTLLAAASGMAALLLFVMPQFRPIFESMNVELPALTQVALGLTGDSMPFGIVILAGVAIGTPLIFTKAGTRLTRALLYRRTAARRLAELARSLAGFLERGVPASNAFRALSEAYGDTFPERALDGVVLRLESGTTIANALRPEKAFPRTFVWLVGAAEERGTLPATLEDLAGQYERAFKRRLKLVEAVIAPLALIVIGAIVLGGILAIFLPIFKLQQSLVQ